MWQSDAMGFRASEIYPADVETAFALLCDPEMIVARFEHAGDTDVEIQRCEPDGDGFVIESTRTVTIDVPGFARKVLSPSNQMTQVERWEAPADDGSRQGSMTVDVAGVPSRTSADYELLPTDDGGTEHTVQGEMELKIPLIGKKLGNFLSGTITDTAAADLAFVRDRLG